MATVRPFRAFRPPAEFAARVAARPYDVMNADEARAEAAGNPISFLHVSRPEIDLPPETDPYDAAVYRQGRANLEKMFAGRILEPDAEPSFYLYSQSMGAHTQYGIAGCVSVSEYRDGIIRKHELTRKEKEDDRATHIKATGAHSGPVLLAYRSQQTLDGIIAECAGPSPVIDFVASDGVRHRLWRIHQPDRLEAIVRAFAGVRHLYIADGHHRAAAAARVAEELAGQRPAHAGQQESDYFLAVLFPHTQLRIMDYNRVVADLGGRSHGEFLQKLAEKFTIRETDGQARPGEKGEFGMYLHGRWYMLTMPPSPPGSKDPVRGLDVSALQDRLLGPVLGIGDPRTDRRIDFVGGIRGLAELERRVDRGGMAVAFALYPTSIEEMLAVADAGMLMPPKSTWFEPKLRDGLLVHLLS